MFLTFWNLWHSHSYFKHDLFIRFNMPLKILALLLTKIILWSVIMFLKMHKCTSPFVFFCASLLGKNVFFVILYKGKRVIGVFSADSVKNTRRSDYGQSCFALTPLEKALTPLEKARTYLIFYSTFYGLTLKADKAFYPWMTAS